LTGPPYPPEPVTGSNAIGSFEIGVSPIGDIAPFNPWATIISQYANSPIIDAWITQFNSAMDQTENFDNLYDFVWNLNTAVGNGLDTWGRILGITRVIQIAGTAEYFGFEEANAYTFNQESFFSSAPATTNYNLSDPAYRTLLFAKAATNITNGSIPAINAILLSLFPNRGVCYVADNGGMSMTYTFLFPLTQVEVGIVTTSGVLPAPVGVAIGYSYA
jgi:Protein of unknown function (DUF2612)